MVPVSSRRLRPAPFTSSEGNPHGVPLTSFKDKADGAVSSWNKRRHAATAALSDQATVAAPEEPYLDPSVFHRRKRTLRDSSCIKSAAAPLVVEEPEVLTDAARVILAETKNTAPLGYPTDGDSNSPYPVGQASLNQNHALSNSQSRKPVIDGTTQPGAVDRPNSSLDLSTIKTLQTMPLIGAASSLNGPVEDRVITTTTTTSTTIAESGASPLPAARRVSNSYIQQTISFMPTSTCQSESTSAPVSRSPTSSPSRPAKQPRANILSKPVTLTGMVPGEKPKTNTALHAIRDLYRNASTPIDNSVLAAEVNRHNSTSGTVVTTAPGVSTYSIAGDMGKPISPAFTANHAGKKTTPVFAQASLSSNSIDSTSVLVSKSAPITAPKTNPSVIFARKNESVSVASDKVPQQHLPSGRSHQPQHELTQCSKDAVGVSLYLQPPPMQQQPLVTPASLNQRKNIPFLVACT